MDNSVHKLGGSLDDTKRARTVVELAQLLAQLLTSVRAAARGGGTLALDARREGATVALEVVLRGRDLQLGGDDWRAAGLGLWAARRAVDAQGGRLVEPEAPVQGALAWRVVLPSADA